MQECSSPGGIHFCAGGCSGNWHVCNGNHTEIIVLAYVSQHDAARCVPLSGCMHLQCTKRQKRIIVRDQGHSGNSGEAGVLVPSLMYSVAGT